MHALRRVVASALLSLPLLMAGAAPTLAQQVLDLDVGTPDRRDKHVAVVLDGIVDTRDGAVLTPDQAAARLERVRLLLVGEGHTAIDSHRAQESILRALVRAGRRVLIGLEMFPVTEQASLDAWIRQRPAEQEFVRSSHWYEHWGYNWGYYRDIFVFARRAGIPMFALNAPREVVTAVRQKGLAGLTPAQRAYLPERVDTDSPDHLRLFKAYFGDDDALHSGMNEQQWQAMFAAQCTWDATMGGNAVRALREHGGEGAIMVVLVGSGHVAYGLGIERQVHNFFDGPTATMIPVAVADEEGRPVDTVRASYADYVWGIPAERAPLYPSLGLSLRAAGEDPGLTVLFADEEGPAARAGVRAGDRLLSLDGRSLPDKETFNRLVADKRWGDGVQLEFARGRDVRSVSLVLRRSR